MTTNHKILDWEERFDKKFWIGFCKDDDCHGCGEDKQNLKKIKSFISSLLEASHKEIIGKLEGKKIPLWQDEDVKGFNYGLDTSIRIIKDLSKLK